jgi:hypothetical protein
MCGLTNSVFIARTPDRTVGEVCELPVTRGGSSRVRCEARVAVAVARGQFGNPGKATSAVRTRYRRTSEGTTDKEDQLRV